MLQLKLTLNAVFASVPSPTKFLKYPSIVKAPGVRTTLDGPEVISSYKYGPPVVETKVPVTF